MAGNPWFRMYTDFLNDPKMISLSFEDQRHFIGVLALKSEGCLDNECAPYLLDRIVAQRLWIDHAIITEVKRRLMGAGLITGDWQPVAWERRQFRSDHDTTAAERKRRQRERERAASAGQNSGESESQRAACDGHKPVTPIDTDTDTEQPLPSVVVACAHEREEPTTTTAPTARPAVRQHPRQNFQQLLQGEITDAYREILESAGALPIAQWTANRTFKAQMWWEQFGMTLEGWREYLLCIRNNCGWLLRRRRGKEGRPLPPTSVDFVMTEQCYLAVAEGRYDEVAA